MDENDKNIKSILQDAVEKELPSSQIDLWKSIKASLLVHNHPTIQQGENMKKTQSTKRMAMVFVISILVLGMSFFTPLGRVWAEKLFFLLQLTPYSSTPTPIPSLTPTPYALDDIQMQINHVNDLAGFVILRPSQLPYGYRFWGADYNPENKLACQWYGYGPQPDPSTNGSRGLNGDMFLCQSRKARYLGFDSVGTPGPSVTVEVAQIGSIIGEYTALDTFREYLTWEQDGFYMYIVVYGTAENTRDRIYLSKEEMVTVASSMNTASLPQLTATPGSTLTAKANISLNFDSVNEVEKYVGYPILKPSILPKNFVFAGAMVVEEQGAHHVILDYRSGHPQGNIAGIFIEQIPLSAADRMINFRQVYPLNAITDIMVGQWSGLFVEGEFKQDEIITPGPTPIPIWLADSPARDLTWQTDKFVFRIRYWANAFYEGRLEKDEILKIADGLK